MASESDKDFRSESSKWLPTNKQFLPVKFKSTSITFLTLPFLLFFEDLYMLIEHAISGVKCEMLACEGEDPK